MRGVRFLFSKARYVFIQEGKGLLEIDRNVLEDYLLTHSTVQSPS
jgi:hypothetical protein